MSEADDGVQLEATLRLGFITKEACTRARDALAPESLGFLELRVEDSTLVARVPPGSLPRVLATVDDTLACLQAALETTGQAGA